jgi:hypothetical protein
MSRKLTSAVAATAIGLFATAGTANAQSLLNGDWENPINTTDATSTVADNWVMSPAVGATFTNPGQRCVFGNNTAGGRWSFWMQAFTKNGNATQTIGGITAGNIYRFSTDIRFENNYNTIPGNQTVIGIQYLDAGNNAVGPFQGTLLLPPDITPGPAFTTYFADALAPAGATQAQVFIGWDSPFGASGGGLSAFADSSTFAQVPEPGMLSLAGLAGAAMLVRRRK